MMLSPKSWDVFISLAASQPGDFFYFYLDNKNEVKNRDIALSNLISRSMHSCIFEKVNIKEGKLYLNIGSVIHVVNGNDPNSYLGLLPTRVLYSDFPLNHPAKEYIRPILHENGGFEICCFKKNSDKPEEHSDES